MKEEWKGAELRETAREIRGSVMPKSITPEMVGGTLEGLAAAVDEVVETLGEIPREHVKVRVRATDDGVTEVETAGGTVRLDVFAVGGFPCYALPRQELTVGADGTVEFDVPWGCKYAVSSHVEGLGASFQLVFEAGLPERTVRLWNFPIGVFALGHTDLFNYNYKGSGYERYTAIPFITNEWVEEVPPEYAMWAFDEEEYEGSEGWWYIGVLVSTAETTFALGRNNLSEESMVWCESRGYNTLFPLVDYYNFDRYAQDWDWDESREKAICDYDGHMNTVKILASMPTHKSALWATTSEADYDEQRWLPSAGELYIMWLNRDAINRVLDGLRENVSDDFKLLPYQDSKGNWVRPNNRYEYWWSSTQLDKICSWVVYYIGNVYYYDRNDSYDVRAVSAFHFEY